MSTSKESTFMRAIAVGIHADKGTVHVELGATLAAVIDFRFPLAEAEKIANKLRDGDVFEIATNVNTGPAEPDGRWFAFAVAGDEGWTRTRQALVDPGMMWILIGELEGLEIK